MGNGPTGIAAADGALWVVNALDGTVSRVDPLTDAVTKTLQIPDGPSAIGATAGAVWVTEEFGSHLVRIDAAQGVITASIPLESRPEALAATDAGVWVSAQSSGSGHRGGRLVVMGSFDSIDPSAGELFPDPQDLAYDALTFLREPGGTGGIEVVPATPTTDTDRTVSRRSEPSSCTTLTGEQPDPWDLLQPQDVISRHRGAKPRRRCELSGAISLLSPAYLLSVAR